MMAASQGCTGLGVWPYTEGSLVMVKDPYARQKLREKAQRLLFKYLGFSFVALIGFLSFARFVIEPVIAPRDEVRGAASREVTSRESMISVFQKAMLILL